GAGPAQAFEHRAVAVDDGDDAVPDLAPAPQRVTAVGGRVGRRAVGAQTDQVRIPGQPVRASDRLERLQRGPRSASGRSTTTATLVSGWAWNHRTTSTTPRDA